MRKWIAIGLGVLLLGMAFAAVYLSLGDSQVRPPRMTGKLWCGTGDGAGVFYHITEEERSRSVLGKSDDMVTQNFSRFRVLARSTESGAVLSSEHLGDTVNSLTGTGPTILGPTSSSLWVWNYRLEARDPKTLALRLTEEDLLSRNAALASIIPEEHTYYRAAKARGTLVFKGLDAKYYEIEDASGKIVPLSDEFLRALTWSKSAEDGFRSLERAGEAVSHVSESDFLVSSFVTSTGKWYALLSDEERSRLGKWPGRARHPYGDVSRCLYNVAYKLDDRNQPEIDPAELAKLGGRELLKGGFLIRAAPAVWDVPDPSSTLIFLKEKLGEHSPWHLGRLGRDGTVIWSSSTGLSKVTQVGDAGRKLLLYGTQAPREEQKEPEAGLVLVDSVTGQVVKVPREGGAE